jgi:TIR domain
MGIAIRKYNAFKMRLYQGLKRKFVSVLTLMKPGFSDEAFVEEFRSIYSEDWRQLASFHDYYSRMDETRPGKKFDFPPPKRYLLECTFPLRRNTRQKHEKGECLSSEDQAMLREQLTAEAHKKQKKREVKTQRRQETVQSVAPQYLNELRNLYHTSDLHKRIDIVKEMAKYRHPETVAFLYRILGGEKDYFIRQEAFFALQRFGNVVFLPRKKDGKKDKQDRLMNRYGGYTEDLGKGPSEVLHELECDSVQQHRQYDVFLSHSTKDHEMVLSLVSKLNALDQVVYVDWISDKEDLDRQKANDDTSQVLIERISASRCVLLMRTLNSDQSPWTAWELDIAVANKKRVCIYDLEEKSPAPDFVTMHPNLTQRDDGLFVRVGDQDVTFVEWIGDTKTTSKLGFLGEA